MTAGQQAEVGQEPTLTGNIRLLFSSRTTIMNTITATKRLLRKA
jgi:hypothetical protein